LIDRLVNKVPLGQFHGLVVMRLTATQKRSVTPNCSRRIRPIWPCSDRRERSPGVYRSAVLRLQRSRSRQGGQLDEICRNQQVNDGAFASLDEVPRDALSLTIPTLMARPKLFAIAPGPAKRQGN
jgi:hypothetical protein